ncbi:MAG: SDR family oxidoreductase [Candidatus Omnitrophica bacterium]|nr:SDR family oxidoreductase [Candidatus Omnitrophota bacterium]
MQNSIEGRIVLITGCSSGFGLQTAAHLASRGCKVIATMRNLEKQNALLSEVQRRGGEVEVCRLDVTDKNSIKETITEIAAKYGYVDALVNNAGIGSLGFFEDLADEEIRQMMDINFFGVQNVTRQVIPMMRHRKQGKIINISSVSGFSASPAFGSYNASKWALEAFSESLRYELRMFGIDVLLIEPGVYRTNLFYENSHFARHYDNPESPYYPLSQYIKKRIMEYVEDCHKDIEEVPVLIEKLIRAKNPSFRNIPDIEGKTLYVLRKILPFSVYSWVVRTAVFRGYKFEK